MPRPTRRAGPSWTAIVADYEAAKMDAPIHYDDAWLESLENEPLREQLQRQYETMLREQGGVVLTTKDRLIRRFLYLDRLCSRYELMADQALTAAQSGEAKDTDRAHQLALMYGEVYQRTCETLRRVAKDLGIDAKKVRGHSRWRELRTAAVRIPEV